MGELGINGWNLIIQLVAFGIFIFLLWRYALGPIVNVLDTRTNRVRESMEAAQRMQAELQATATIARARDEAGKQADEYLVRAQDALRQETTQARLALREEVADLAVMAAGKIVRKELDPASQTRLIEETLAEASSGRMGTNGTSSSTPPTPA
jgi:F-type H+-transporting ATPase subunit b